MDVTVQAEVTKPLLKRKDVRVRIFHGGPTPSRSKLIGTIAGTLGASKETIVVRAIRAEFGNASSIVDASVYESASALEQFEPEYVRKRHASKDAPSQEAPGAAEKPTTEGDA